MANVHMIFQDGSDLSTTFLKYHIKSRNTLYILDKNRMTYRLTPTVFRCKLPGH